MTLELAYNFRHLVARPITTGLTLSGIALVVFVYTATLMLSEGVNKTLGTTGSDENAIILRTGAQNEIQSGVNREHANIISAQPEVVIDKNGKPLATHDVVVLISLKKRADNQPSNVNVRGVSEQAIKIRPSIKIIEGRIPTPGTQEVMVGKEIFQRFIGTEINKSLRMVSTDWPVVGIFDAGNSAFNSEVWGDSNIMLPAFKRDRFSSITIKLKSEADFTTFQNRIENDPRLSLFVKKEKQFYADQSSSLVTFITILGTFVSVVFSIGAVIGAMITMYSAVANRVREIGVLRALGFQKGSILFAFLTESLLLALAGGLLGILAAYFLSFVRISTTNFKTFSEVAFGFSFTWDVLIKGLIFALLMGILGGLLPALRAGRLKIIECLRQRG